MRFATAPIRRTAAVRAKLGQLELDSIRAFNGYGGTGAFTPTNQLHEFTLETDSQGYLVVNGDEAHGFSARWVPVSPSARPQNGNEAYVDQVCGSDATPADP